MQLYILFLVYILGLFSLLTTNGAPAGLPSECSCTCNIVCNCLCSDGSTIKSLQQMVTLPQFIICLLKLENDYLKICFARHDWFRVLQKNQGSSSATGPWPSGQDVDGIDDSYTGKQTRLTAAHYRNKISVNLLTILAIPDNYRRKM